MKRIIPGIICCLMLFCFHLQTEAMQVNKLAAGL